MKKIIKIIIPIIIFYFIFRTVFSDWHTAQVYLSSINPLYLVLSFLFMIFIYPEGAYAWFRIVKTFDHKTKLKSALPIWIISNTSRYIPGTVWQYLGRMELSVAHIGITRSQAGLSMIYEVFLNLASASILSILIIIYSNILPGWLIVPGIISIIIFLQPKLVEFIINLLIRVLKSRFKNIQTEHDFSVIYKALPWFILNFLLNGIALTFLSMSIGVQITTVNVILFTANYAFSWMVGFLAVVAPGGLGVMEGSLTVLLSSIMPISQAGVIALLYRFFLTVAEIGLFLISTFSYGRKQKILAK